MRNTRCLLVGKGPSAVHVASALTANVDLATINSAATLIPQDWPIDWGFFVDREALDETRGEFPRIRRFILPSKIHNKLAPSILTPDSPELHIPQSRRIIYPHRMIPWKAEATRHAIYTGHIALVCTAVVALQWLCLLGYEEIHIYGCDGGTGHAVGIEGRPGSYDHFRIAQEMAAITLNEQFGTSIRFYPFSATS